MQQEMNTYIATFLRENADELATSLSSSYVLQYPDSPTSGSVAKDPPDLIRSLLLVIADAFQTEDFSIYLYDSYSFGDTMYDAWEQELTLFATFLSCILFQGRTISEKLYNHAMPDLKLASQLMTTCERGIQAILAANCDCFKERMCREGKLRSEWNVNKANTKKISNAEKILLPQTELQLLSSREQEVLDLVMQGFTNKQIAAQLGITTNTAKNHLSRIFAKYNVSSRGELFSGILDGTIV